MSVLTVTTSHILACNDCMICRHLLPGLMYQHSHYEDIQKYTEMLCWSVCPHDIYDINITSCSLGQNLDPDKEFQTKMSVIVKNSSMWLLKIPFTDWLEYHPATSPSNLALNQAQSWSFNTNSPLEVMKNESQCYHRQNTESTSTVHMTPYKSILNLFSEGKTDNNCSEPNKCHCWHHAFSHLGDKKFNFYSPLQLVRASSFPESQVCQQSVPGHHLLVGCTLWTCQTSCNDALPHSHTRHREWTLELQGGLKESNTEMAGMMPL